MDKQSVWIERLIISIYVTLLSLFWFHAIQFFYYQFELPFFPEAAIIWLIIVTLVLVLPLPYLTKQQRNIWLILTLIVGAVSGSFLFGDIGTAIILQIGITWFALSKVVNKISSRDFVTLFLMILIVFGFILAYSYIVSIDEQEISLFIRFFLFSFFITIVGIIVSQIAYKEIQFGKDQFFKQWGILNAFLWGTLGMIVIGSGILLLIGLGIIPLITWVIKTILTPILVAIFSIIPFLQELLGKIQFKGGPSALGTLIKELQNQVKNAKENPVAGTVLDGIIFLGVAAVFVIIVIFLIRAVRNSHKKKVQIKNQDHGKSIIVEASDSQHENVGNWFSSIFSKMNPFSEKNEHPVRKEYRQLLKVLREKGYWTSDSMTVQQLTKRISELEFSSILYEKLRYGDEQLSDEDVELFREDIHKIMKEIKQGK